MTLKERINQNKPVQSMYSIDGANFQEYALSILDYKGSKAHSMIGALVTAINNGTMTVIEAKHRYITALN